MLHKQRKNTKYNANFIFNNIPFIKKAIAIILTISIFQVNALCPPLYIKIYDILTFNGESRKSADWYYTYSLARAYVNPTTKYRNSPELAAQYANAVEKYSEKYNLESRLVARQIFKETKFRRTAKSYEDITTYHTNIRIMKISNRIITNLHITKDTHRAIVAVGPMAVRPFFWSHMLYQLDPKLTKTLLNSRNPNQDHIKYLMVIEYNIEVGCKIIRYLIDKNNGDCRLAYTAYWAGPYSWQYRKAVRNKLYTNDYVNDILYNHLDKKVLAYHNWDYFKVSLDYMIDLRKNNS